ncbi:MAG: RecQ family ATP-dependent DNA helicase [Bacteroidales bacterium]|nr:RecQ family ATP-dependent DNA helicase [Bacteroidales bacterium]
MHIHDILKEFWGYDDFRPLQEDIINSVLEQNDTLALLPTGGGKSICFQVPALKMEGLCVVVTPLIALMKDQVANLKSRGIKAVALYSGMSHHEMSLTIDNCLFGDVKFLYLSPERLKSKDFREALKRMKLNLLAVDEAHCVSQWGYDFRPPYLQISEIREFFPKTPVIALTATATSEVVKDIQKQLRFSKENVFQKSFYRENLIYVVQKEEDKQGRLLRLIRNIGGSGIIYVRNRKKTREIAEFLQQNKIISTYYHAGLDSVTRQNRQDAWMKGSTQVMVSTNAFGMGIDKPDVRFVVHVDIPDGLEAYFQEAGRAGRDGKQSYALLMYDNSNLGDVNRLFDLSYPEIKEIKRVYNALGNYYQLAVGSGKDSTHELDLAAFSNQYSIKSIIVYNSLKFLEREGYIILNEAVNAPSRLRIRSEKADLYRFQVENRRYEPLIKTLLRSYSGLLTEYVRIFESEIAKRLNITYSQVVKMIEHLNKLELLDYIPRATKPQVIYPIERLDENNMRISPETYHLRKQQAKVRLDAVLSYVSNDHLCRSRVLLAYFGETNANDCGLCDVCIARKKNGVSKENHDFLIKGLLESLRVNSKALDALTEEFSRFGKNDVAEVLRSLIDDQIILYDKNGLYRMK